MSDSLFVNAIGMATPVGLNAVQTYYSVKAGVSRIAEINHHDAWFQPYVMGTLPSDCLPEYQYEQEQQLSRVDERRIRLAMLAAEDLKRQISGMLNGVQLPLFMGWPECHDNAKHLLKRVVEQCDLPVDLKQSSIICEGRATGLSALKRGQDYLFENSNCNAVLVGAADSFKSQHLLKYLDQVGRIGASGNSDYFIPGEGACFLLITREQTTLTTNGPLYSRLINMESGFENAHFGNDDVYTGEGLSQCIGALLRKAEAREIGAVYSSKNGEYYWSKEWGVAYLRNQDCFAEEYETHHPAEYIGDSGAASGLIGVALASFDFVENGYAKPILVYASADYGQRTAVLLKPATAQTENQKERS